MNGMDKIDHAIIYALQNDGRLTNQELAERVNLSPSPCLRRVRNLEQSGVITGYSAQVDPKKYGLTITMFVRITLEKHNRAVITRFEEAVQSMDEIMECHLLTGSADYLLRISVIDLDDYNRFMREQLHEISGIAAIDTAFAFGEVKKQNWYKSPVS